VPSDLAGSDPEPSSRGVLARLVDPLRYRPGIALGELTYGERKRSMRKVIVAWCFGTIFFTGITSAPLVGMFRRLGASVFLIGLLAAIPAAMMMLQPLSSWLVMRTGSRKRFFLRVSYPGRLAWIPVVLIGWLFPPSGATIAAMFLLVLVSRFCTEVTSPAWFSWVSDIVPEDERGAFWASRQVWGTVFGALATVCLSWYLGSSPPFERFVVFFCLMAVFGWLDVFIHRGVIGVRIDVPPEQPRIWRMMEEPLRDPRFRPLLIFTLFFSFAHQLGGGMFQLLLLEEIHLSYLEIALYTSGLLGVLTIASSGMWGRLMDNLEEGERIVFYLGAVLVALIAVPWTMIGPRQHVPIALNIAVSGIGWAGYQIALTGLIIAYSPAASRVTYVAVQAAVSGIGYMVGSVVSGALAEAFVGLHGEWGPFKFSPLRILYHVSAAGRLLCLLLLPMIREPSSRPVGVYVRRLLSYNPFDPETWIYVRQKLGPREREGEGDG